MQTILIADNSPRDKKRLSELILNAGMMVEVCDSGAALAAHLENKGRDWAIIIILWELPGPPFGPELLARARRSSPDVPIIVVSDALVDATLATRAFALGASDFLQTPLEPDRVRSCLDALLKHDNADTSPIDRLNNKILGNSPALQATLRQLAKVSQHHGTRVLLFGESGTGKELLAQGLHDLSPDPKAPFIAVNVAAIPKELIESALFGHEKGAFTGASELHLGYMEEAGVGTLFLDELGELDLSLQAKLLRAIQEKKFRRLKGTKELDFKARLVCATNRDLAFDVKQGTFRRDLFHRIAEITIQVPPLRQRSGDIDLLLKHFLRLHGADRKISLARETLSILHSYPFPGNVRELENFVKRALIECDGELILPQHLPLPTMGVFLDQEVPPGQFPEIDAVSDAKGVRYDDKYQDLFRELNSSLPQNWGDLPYKQIVEQYQKAFDRVYLQRLIERHRHNLTKATRAAGVDKKTFAQHWRAAGLPPLRAEGEESSEHGRIISDELTKID
jgi:two-component system nitrogen regulation response regulator NtrX